MRLPRPFYRLPIRFDVERLRAELAACPADAWARHPNEIEGNSSLRLITVNGEQNDEVNGPMRPTPYLRQSPYIRQVLASFNVVWSRSRFMRLSPHSAVPEHADINYHWFTRVRLHIPVVTRPEVRFQCDGEVVHMAAGEAWIFDNWRPHNVENPTDEERVHLVADTSGTAAFWQLVDASDRGQTPPRELAFDPAVEAMPLTENWVPARVMPPAEVEMLVTDLRRELALLEDSESGRMRLAQYHGLLHGFCADWRQLYLLHGDTAAAIGEYTRLRELVRETSRTFAASLIARTNRVSAHTVLEGRVLRHLLPQAAPAAGAIAQRAGAGLERPVFIVAAPRSGSTLLFETLAVSRELVTLGGEAHWLIESYRELAPGAAAVDSNRLELRHCTPELAARIAASVPPRLLDSARQPAGARVPLRWLEKTPKNSLRIPFLRAVFPDAHFIFLWREPRESIASIIEAWRSGRYVTYPQLPGWDGPWSLLLPPGWQTLRGRPLEEIAAFQWRVANRIILDDLATLPAGCWTTVGYRELIDAPATTIARLCGFIGVRFDGALRELLSRPLPLSRYTLSAPDRDKWRAHEAQIQRVLPGVEPLWHELTRRIGS